MNSSWCSGISRRMSSPPNWKPSATTIGQTPLGLPGGMRLTASVGGVMGPGPTSSLVRRADALMYCAKERRNRVVVDLSPAH